MDKRIIALGVGLVAGIGTIVALRYLLDKDEDTGVAQLPDTGVVRTLDEALALAKLPEGWTRWERPQRHEDTAADTT